VNKSLQVYGSMFVQKCGLRLMYKTKADLDETAIVFLPRKFFFYLFTWVKKN